MVKTLFPLVRLDYKKSIEIAKAVKIQEIMKHREKFILEIDNLSGSLMRKAFNGRL